MEQCFQNSKEKYHFESTILYPDELTTKGEDKEKFSLENLKGLFLHAFFSSGSYLRM